MEDDTKAALKWWGTLESWQRTGLAYKYGVYDDSGCDCHKTITNEEILFIWNGEQSESILGPLSKQAQEGLEKLGEKIGDSEWDELFEQYNGAIEFSKKSLKQWLKKNYYPPKPKKK